MTNSRIGIVNFVNCGTKWFVKRSAFLVFLNARNEVETKGRVKSGSRFILQTILKSVHIPNKKTPRKKAVVMKDENEKSEKARKNIHCVVRIKNRKS